MPRKNTDTLAKEARQGIEEVREESCSKRKMANKAPTGTNSEDMPARLDRQKKKVFSL